MSRTAPGVDLRPDHWAIVCSILRQHVPDRKVLAFGSRATWAAKDYSDLDLAIMGDEPLSPDATSALAEGFGESDLPFKVDVVDWARIDEVFRDIIRREGVAVQVPTRTPKATDSAHPPMPTPTTPRKTLGDYFTLQRGTTYKSSLLGQPGPLLLGLATIQRNGGFRPNSLRTYGGDSPDHLMVQPGDLYVSLKDVTQSANLLGAVARLPSGQFPGRLTQDTVKLVPKFDDVPSDYIYWLLRTPQSRAYCRTYATGTTNLGLAREDFLAFPVPEVNATRCRIVDVLAALDDKIELNRRMNETLEAIARVLFKSWFVDFDPVRAKMEGHDTGLPRHLADLFPDRLVDSELGEIPEGWKVIPLDAIARFQNGLALQRFRPAQNEARLPVVKIAQLRADEANSGEWASATIRPECIIEDGDVLFSWSGSLLVKTWCGGRAALNQHLFKVTSGRHPKWFYLNSLLSHLPAFRRIAQDKATTMGHIRRHHLTDALCVVPPDAVIAGISDTFAWLLERQVANELVGRTSVALRETLLPKLISGEIRVGDAEMALESVT